MSRLIDRLMPEWDVAARYQTEVAAAPDRTFAAVRQTDLADSTAARALLALRALPSRFRGRASRLAAQPLTIDRLLESRFGLLADDPPNEIVLGFEGRFWRPIGELRPVDAEGWSSPLAAEWARGCWSFAVEDRGGGCCRLTTETRVRAGGGGSRRAFRAYWLLVGPFSGLIRREMLRLIRKRAEAG